MFRRRLEKVEVAIAQRRQVAHDPVDLSRLSEDELRVLEALTAKARGSDGACDLSQLTDGELHMLAELVRKACTGVT